MTSRGGRPRVDDETISALTLAGWTAAQIAEHCGCSARTVNRSRKRSGIAQPGPDFVTEQEIEVMRRLLDDGCSFREVVRSTGRSICTVMRHFPGRGWTPQQASEFQAALRQASKALR